MVLRCAWVTDDPVYIAYHDHEWGEPVDDDHHFFEMLTLEGAQAGLSWITILKRRETYRQAFDYFCPQQVSTYDEEKVQQLLNNKGLIRHELKIRSVITNARAFVKIQQEYGSFSNYIWKFVGDKSIHNHWQTSKEIPASTKESIAMSKDLKKRGFKFVGPTICYAFMQATGLVNDHTRDCFLYHG